MENKHTRRGCTQVNGVGQALPDVTNCQVKPDLHKQQSGFTLIELLVVFLIIGILAAVAVPQYQKAVLKSRLVQMQIYMDALRKGAELFYLQNGYYTNNIEQIDIDITSFALEIKQSGITSNPIKGVFFEHEVECVAFEYAVACLSPDFYLLRKLEYADEIKRPQLVSWPKGLACRGYNTLADQVCKGLSSTQEEVPAYSTSEHKAYIIGN